MTAGTYSTTPFDPVFRFTVGDGWANFLSEPAVGSIINTARTGFGWGTGMREGTNTAIGSSVDALIAFLATQPGVTASDPVPVTIGGMSGQAIDLTIKDADVFFIVGPQGKGAGWTFSKGFKVRAIGLNVRGTVVLFAIEVASTNAFDAQIVVVQDLLDSIVWE